MPQLQMDAPATVLSKDQLDWLIVGGSYLFFAIIWWDYPLQYAFAINNIAFKLHWNGLYNKNARNMVLSLQACWNISSFKYTSRNNTEFSQGIYMVNYSRNSRVTHLWIRARNNSAIPIMPDLDPDLASETKPISQYENFNYGGWVLTVASIFVTRIFKSLKSQLNDRWRCFLVNFRFCRMLKISFLKIAPNDSSWNFRGSL